MIITRLNGGLGNQMFQYAFGRRLAYKNNTKFFLDIAEFSKNLLRQYELDCFPIKAKIITSTQLLLIKPFLIKMSEKKYGINKDCYKLRNNVYLSGYWQSEKYFLDISEIIKKDFVFPSHLSPQNQKLLHLIASSNSVGIHIRRGDYITNAKTYVFHGTCPVSYYQSGINLLNKRLSDIKVFVFSDDLNWSKCNLRFSYPTFFVENSSQKPYEDMNLMSLCKHNIIANSSFSWWAAWLNSNKNKIVIAPQKWFNDSTLSTFDLIPQSWITI